MNSLPLSIRLLIFLTANARLEYTYTRYGDAQNKINSIMNKGESEFVVCDEEEIHYLQPKYIEDEDQI